MPYLALLGDSVLDNQAYVQGGPSVVMQVRTHLPPSWKCDLFAVDGSTTQDIADQLTRLPSDVTHLVLSVGGNDAILRADVLDAKVESTAEAFTLLADAAQVFERSYRHTVDACLTKKLPLVVCTIYGGNFESPEYQTAVRVALLAFNDVIVSAAVTHGLRVVDLRRVCDRPEDYANPIEPSTIGGQKIALALVAAVLEQASPGCGARIVG